jgi:hypothetical protein
MSASSHVANRLAVFVSSTSSDLAYQRATARDLILEAQWHPVMMEYFGTSPKPTVAECLERVEHCHLLILIIGHRQGWIPAPEDGGDGVSSITQLEYEHAKRRRIPTLVLCSTPPKSAPVPETVALRTTLNQVATFFEEGSADDFGRKLAASITQHKERLLSKRDRFHALLLTVSLGAAVLAIVGASFWIAADAALSCDLRRAARSLALGAGLAAALVGSALLHRNMHRLERRRDRPVVVVGLLVAALALGAAFVKRNDGCDIELLLVHGVITDQARRHPAVRVTADGYDVGSMTAPDGKFGEYIRRDSVHHQITFRAFGDSIEPQEWTVLDLEARIQGDKLDLGEITVYSREAP